MTVWEDNTHITAFSWLWSFSTLMLKQDVASGRQFLPQSDLMTNLHRCFVFLIMWYIIQVQIHDFSWHNITDKHSIVHPAHRTISVCLTAPTRKIKSTLWRLHVPVSLVTYCHLAYLVLLDGLDSLRSASDAFLRWDEEWQQETEKGRMRMQIQFLCSYGEVLKERPTLLLLKTFTWTDSKLSILIHALFVRSDMFFLCTHKKTYFHVHSQSVAYRQKTFFPDFCSIKSLNLQ